MRKEHDEEQDAPDSPRRNLREKFLLPLGMLAHALSQAIRVPATRVYDIVNGNRGVTADTALRLARYFGNSPEYWLNLQAAYNLRSAEREAAARIEREVSSAEDGVTCAGRRNQRLLGKGVHGFWIGTTDSSISVIFSGAGTTRTTRDAFSATQNVGSGGFGFRYELAPKFGLHGGIDFDIASEPMPYIARSAAPRSDGRPHECRVDPAFAQ